MAHGLADLFTTAVAAPATVPEPVVEVAQALARLAPDAAGPLEVRVLRGGMDCRPEGPRHPAAATVLVGTIDLVGSRLLWRGYGVSRGRRPIDAAIEMQDDGSTLVGLQRTHGARGVRLVGGDGPGTLGRGFKWSFLRSFPSD
ncbi:hypothetical protein GCM10009638_06230 [Luteococcus sanguinis]